MNNIFMKENTIKIIATTVLTLALAACASNGKDDLPKNMLVYVNNGAIQCESDGKTGAETAALLKDAGVIVSKTQCGHLTNVVVAAMCGGQATNINVHEIAASDLEKAKSVGFEDVITLKQDDKPGYNAADCK